MANFLRKADLFSRPFQFSIGEGSTNRQTIFGGGLSLGIISVSLIYLIYLLEMYFTNRILPKSTKEVFLNSNEISKQMIESLYKFKMMMHGKPLQDYERKMGKRYIEFELTYERYQVGHGYSIDILPQKACEGDEFAGFTCLDYDRLTEQQRTLTQDPSIMLGTQHGLRVKKCVDAPDCADPSEIDDAINQLNTYMIIYTGLENFNKTTSSIQLDYGLEYLSFDSGFFYNIEIGLQKSFTTVQTGVVISTDRVFEHLIQSSRKDTLRSIAKSEDGFGFVGYAYIDFIIDTYYQANIIQYPQVTEILTQFTSVFSILIITGFFANRVADLDIVHEIADIWLKEYFKQTALRFIDFNCIPKAESQKKLTDKISFFQAKIKSLDFLKRPFSHAKFSIFMRQFQSINRCYCCFFNFLIGGGNYSLIESFLILEQLIFFRYREVKQEEFSEKEKQIYNKITQYTSKKIDVRELYRDLIKVKMAIKLMLTENQYAALHFCGRDIVADSQVEKKLQENKQKKEIEKTKTQTADIEANAPMIKVIQTPQQDEQENLKSELGFELQIVQSIQSPVAKTGIAVLDAAAGAGCDSNAVIAAAIASSQSITVQNQYESSMQSRDIFNSELIKSSQETRFMFNFSQQKKKLERIEQKQLIEKDDVVEQEVEEEIESLEKMRKLKKNHLDSIDEIETIESRRADYFDQFIKRIQSSEQPLSDIDKNIFSALINSSKFDDIK